MPPKNKPSDNISLFFSRSTESTRINQTGAWRFVRPVVDEKTAPCSVTCPAGEDIARIQMMSARGDFHQAWQTILEENPFPAICGYVCYHPCETVCNRAAYDQPIGIHAIERFLGNRAVDEQWPLPTSKMPSTGFKVAIIGAGPAGLSAAFFLTRLGHACEIFEAQSAPGGLLRWGIPSFRLPPPIVTAEIARLTHMGVRLNCGHPIDATHLKALQKHYDALFIGCGHQQTIKLHLPGEDLAVDGRQFLQCLQQGERPVSQGRLAVIGGGNTAVDVARSLVRLGAEVILCYRRRRQDMPAFASEIDAALEEGVQLKELVGPLAIEPQDDRFELRLAMMNVIDAITADGRARVVPSNAPGEALSVSGVITALGAGAAMAWQQPLEQSQPQIDLEICRLTRERVPVAYGGDLTNATPSVAAAIASGKTAAMAFDTYFKQGWETIADRLASCRVGDGAAYSMAIYEHLPREHRSPAPVPFTSLNMAYFKNADRMRVKTASADVRARTFDTTVGSYTANDAQTEAGRCFNCGICNACDNCHLFCPELAVIEKPQRHFALEYCKGCGICVVECPRCALSLKEETQ